MSGFPRFYDIKSAVTLRSGRLSAHRLANTCQHWAILCAVCLLYISGAQVSRRLARFSLCWQIPIADDSAHLGHVVLQVADDNRSAATRWRRLLATGDRRLVDMDVDWGVCPGARAGVLQTLAKVVCCLTEILGRNVFSDSFDLAQDSLIKMASSASTDVRPAWFGLLFCRDIGIRESLSILRPLSVLLLPSLMV